MRNRRAFLRNTSLLGLASFVPAKELFAFVSRRRERSEGILADPDPLIAAPEDSNGWATFRDRLREWRLQKQKDLNYSAAAYEDRDFEWTQRNFVCYFLMLYDLDLYDRHTNRYTVHKVVERGKNEFGGYDSVVLWHAYPRIGLDERNQFDYYRDMPGGLTGLKETVDEFHKYGIKAFIAYYPWDKSTRRETDADAVVIAGILKDINADGIFLDTMKGVGADFTERLASVRKGIALEAELALDVADIAAHHLSWAQWFNDRFVPGVLRNKWFERRHMQHQIARWNRDHSTELQMAWMNGSGMMVWENVFGQWMSWTERDRSTLRKMLPIQRRFWKLFTTENWTPLVPTLQYGVFASLWEWGGLRLWTLVNRNQNGAAGNLLEVDHEKNHVYYNLISGESVTTGKKKILLRGSIEARSVGCFISGSEKDLPDGFHEFISGISKRADPADSLTVRSAMTTRRIRVADAAPGRRFDPSTMVEIPPATILLTTVVLNREAGSYESQLPVQMVLNTPLRYDKTVHVPHLAADITPVTNKAFYEFLKATNYSPAVKHNFLRHWDGNRYPAGKDDHPVVWVDLSDARAFCQWAGKRLPTEGEWQFLAQGYERLAYPWGQELKADYCNGAGPDTTGVFAFPQGKSPFGLLDMCGNTWELTDSEYTDEHNRFCMLKGGSWYKATDSIWYTQGGPQPSANSIKFLMLYPGLDRSSTIGFRCVMDLAG